MRQGFWLNDDDFVLSIGNSFAAGRVYKYKVVIDAVACKFAPEATVLINGETADVEVDGDTVTAYASFLCAEKPAYTPGDINSDGVKSDVSKFPKLEGNQVYVIKSDLKENLSLSASVST